MVRAGWLSHLMSQNKKKHTTMSCTSKKWQYLHCESNWNFTILLTAKPKRQWNVLFFSFLSPSWSCFTTIHYYFSFCPVLFLVLQFSSCLALRITPSKIKMAFYSAYQLFWLYIIWHFYSLNTTTITWPPTHSTATNTQHSHHHVSLWQLE